MIDDAFLQSAIKLIGEMLQEDTTAENRAPYIFGVIIGLLQQIGDVTPGHKLQFQELVSLLHQVY